MKVLRYFISVLFCFSAVLFLSGCENFLQGASLKEELEAQIEYANAKNVNVLLKKADIDDNGTLYPAANGVSAKVGIESFKISYTASSTYFFLYWQALDKDNNILNSDVVKFDDPRNAVTSVTVYTESEVIIQAVTSPVPKAVVNFKKNYDAAGTVTFGETTSFLMDEEFSFSFTPADGYQFIKWQTSNNCVAIANPESLSTKAVAKADGAVTITAICAERPHVKSFNPNPSQTESVCKDSYISIIFDKPLGNSEKELSDIKLYLNNVELYYGEEEAFGNPYFYFDKDEKGDKVINYSTVVIPAHSKYALDVPAGTTLVIRVVLPDSLYYFDEENDSRIYLCEDSWTYKINENTNDKANIKAISDYSTGTLTGSNGEYKEYNIGKKVEFSFKTNSNSKFLGWNKVILPSSDSAVIEESSDNGVEKLSIRVVEVCKVDVEVVAAVRPSVTSVFPAVPKTGVSFDTETRIQFAVNEKYTLNEEELLAGVSITYDGQDFGEYFDISFSENELVLSPKEDPSSLLELRGLLFSSGLTGIKQLKINIPASCVYYEYQFKNEKEKIDMAADYVYSYNVDSSTSIKTVIKIDSNDKKEYSLGDTLDLNLNLADEYQFIEWQVSDKNAVKIEDEKSLQTQLIVKEYGKEVTVKSVTAPRPKFTTNTDSKDMVYAKDTSLYITFDRALSADNDLSKIQMYAGNVQLAYGEKEAFGNPVFYVSGDETDCSKIVIPANTFSALDVAAGKTLTISVMLPSDLYYKDAATGEKIYLCNEGDTKSWQYKVNEKTFDEVSFELVSDTLAGTMTGKAGNYNLGAEVTYTYKPNSAYKFIGWNVTQEPNETQQTTDIVEIEKSTADGTETIRFTTKAAGTVKVEAVTAQKLIVSSLTPVKKMEGVSKNSDIVITFNKAIANTDLQVLDKIRILLDGVDVKNCYKAPVISEDKKTVTFNADNKTLLPVEKGTGIVSVNVPADFYYNVSDEITVNLEEYSSSFVVNASTLEKATVNINAASGTITPSGSYSYNIGDTFEVLYTPESGYKFTDWVIEKGTAKAELVKKLLSSKYLVRFYDDESKSTYKDYFEVTFTESIDKYQASFTVLEEISGCSIRPSYSLIPSVISMVPAFSNSGTAFDENVEIEFNKSMNPECFKGFYSEDVASTQNYAVSITDKNGMDLSELFNLPVGSEDNKKWTIRPDAGKIQTLLATETFADIYVTVKTSATDSSEDAMHIEKEYAKSYRINRNHETIPPKFEVLNFASSKDKLAKEEKLLNKRL